MKRTYKSALAALPLMLAIATAAVADSSATPMPQGTPGGHMGQWLQTKLGLSSDQVQKIQALKAANKDVRKQLRSQLHQAMSDARQAALNGADDVDAKNAAATKLFGEMLDLRAKELQQIGQVLTPDQRTAFASLKPGGGRGHWKHHHHSQASATSTPQE